MTVHELAAAGYSHSADAYERGRPEYPAEATRHLTHALCLSEDSCVLDLGAGTGKFTQWLARMCSKVIAIEPVASMRERLAANVPRATILDGTAEKIPLSAGLADAVTVAQAFHWFDGALALAEIHRVLKPGGRLGLVWNVRDESVEWLNALTRLIDPYEGNAPRHRTGQWKDAFRTTPLFSQFAATAFTHIHECSPEAVVDRVASVSFISALARPERAHVLTTVRRLLATHPETRDKSVIAMHYRTQVFVANRQDACVTE